MYSRKEELVLSSCHLAYVSSGAIAHIVDEASMISKAKVSSNGSIGTAGAEVVKTLCQAI